ncbi:MAG TPA: RNA polymerase subunit sigma-24 [Clostridiales bacterium]|nr:RNA polymerase subunit sigma-24 [Clostridiales bacterium]
MQRELIKKSKKGDIEAFEKLIEEHKIYAYNIALKILMDKEDAKNISQKALIKAFESIENFNVNSSFNTWLYRIIFKTCIDYKRKKRLEPSSLDEPIHFGYDDIPKQRDSTSKNSEKFLKEKLDDNLIKVSIDMLKDEDKGIILFKDILEFNYKELSQVLQCRERILESGVSKARKNLKEIIRKNI